MSQTVSVTVSQTISVGDFETIRPTVTFEDSILENETPEEAHRRVSLIARRLWCEEMGWALQQVSDRRMNGIEEWYTKLMEELGLEGA